MKDRSRRSFIKKSSLAIAGASLYSSMPSNLFGSNAPSNRVNIGLIGVGFGMASLSRMLEHSWVHCIAMCDVNQERLENQANNLKQNYPNNTKNLRLYSDFRRLLENRDLDGVIIATPDHWHTYIFAAACSLDLAIYVEKPTGHTIAECNTMIDFQQEYNNIVTTGLWQTSQSFFVEANKILKTGILGDVFKIHAWLCNGTDPTIYDPQAQSVPDSFDYNMWLGPAPSRPYLRERVRSWRNYWDYGGGQQTDWGVHWIDSVFDGIKALGHERLYPKSVYSVGYRHPNTMTETPRNQTSIFQYDNFHVVWEQQVSHLYNRNQGVAWIGSNGTLVCNRSGFELIPERRSDGHPIIPIAKMEGEHEEGGLKNHVDNWLECIRNNNVNTNSPIDKGSFASILCNIANISHRLDGQSLIYIPDEQKFLNNTKADEYILADYNNDWEYPQL